MSIRWNGVGIAGLLALFLMIGCSSENKEAPQENVLQMKGNAPVSAHGNMSRSTSGGIAYTAPEGWVKEMPASQMRKDQYRWPGVEGKDPAELAVFFFPGQGGSVEANLQRWYAQFHKPNGGPVSEPENKEMMTVSGIPVTVVYVSGTYMASMMAGGPKDPAPGYAMLAAIAETAGGPWFFKATGPKETVDHWRESFIEYVKTFHVE